MKRILLAGVLLSVLVPSLASGQQRTPTIYQLGDGVTAPSVVKRVEPTYPPRARASGVQGFVYVEAVVLENGTVTGAKAIRSRLYSAAASANRRESPTFLTDAEVTTLGLDERAVAAAGQWTFTPGTREGKAVPVRITLELTFTLPRPNRGR